jgi:hypothetical protein
MISQQNVPFLVQKFGPETHIVWDSENKLVKITNWGDAGEEAIDIAEEHAISFTNSTTVEDACRLIELAYMTGCLMMPCFYDQFRKGREEISVRSVFHGVPLVQTSKLFECVRADEAGGMLSDASGKYFTFTPSFKLLDEEDKEVPCQILVGKELFHDVVGTGVGGALDLCLVGINVPVKKAYFIRIMRGDVVCWGGYCNLVKPNIHASVHNGDGALACRKRWAAQSPVVYDPFAVASDVPVSDVPSSKKKKSA